MSWSTVEITLIVMWFLISMFATWAWTKRLNKGLQKTLIQLLLVSIISLMFATMLFISLTEVILG